MVIILLMTMVRCMVNNNLYVSPQTGGYIFVDGALATISTGINQLNFSLAQPLGSYIYNKDMGNPLLNIRGIATASQIRQAISYVASPIIASGNLISVTVMEYSLSITRKNRITIKAVCPITGENEITWSKPN